MGMFTTAQRTQAKVRIALDGPSGSGKTYSALLIAKGLAGGDWTKVALIDTERGSGSLYADLGPYAYAMLAPPYTVEKYLTAIHGAEAEGFAVIVVDSMTHAWSGEGGVLDFVDKVAASQTRGNSFAAWKAGTPVQQKLIDAILASPCHVIATMRSKTEWVLEQNAQGKQVPKKVGLAPDQRKDVDYEFTVVLDLSREHVAQASKDRTGLFDSRIEMPSEAMGTELLTWLAGASQAPAPQPIEQVDPAQLPIGPEAWARMMDAAGQFHVSPEQLLAEASLYQYQGTGEGMPRGLAEYVFMAARNKAMEIAQAAADAQAQRQTQYDAQREQAAAAQQQAPPVSQTSPPVQQPPAPAPTPDPAAQAPAQAPDPAQAPWAPTPGELISMNQAGQLRAMLVAKGIDERAFCSAAAVESVDRLLASRWDEVVASIRALPDPAPLQPGPTQVQQQPQEPAQAAAAPGPAQPAPAQQAPPVAQGAPAGSEAAQQAAAREAQRPNGCTLDASFMQCAAIKRGETPDCAGSGCEHYDGAWAPLDASTRRDGQGDVGQRPPWGTVTKPGSITKPQLDKLGAQCSELAAFGVPENQWREMLWEKASVTSRKELKKSKAAKGQRWGAPDAIDYFDRWLTDLRSGVAAPGEKAVA